MKNPRLRPQNAKFTMLASEELRIRNLQSRILSVKHEDRVCRAWT